MRTPRSGAAILALAVAVSTACSINLNAEQFVKKEQKTFAVSGMADVELKTFDGSIEVTSWDKPEVAITIERRADSQADAEALKVTAEQNGNRIIVNAVKPEGRDGGVQVGFHHGRSVRFVVNVPKTTNLNATSGDGSIAVSGSPAASKRDRVTAALQRTTSTETSRSIPVTGRSPPTTSAAT